MFKLISLTVAIAAISQMILAADAPPAPQKAPPLPFHGVEGYGGVFSTYSAYLVNPGDGEVGLPSMGAIFVGMNHDRSLTSFTCTETLLGRLELGYAYNSFAMGDLPDAIEAATTVRIREDNVVMHNFNARFQVLKEGAYDLAWLPAVTVGAHYKVNTSLDDMDHELGGALTGMGILCGWFGPQV